ISIGEFFGNLLGLQGLSCGPFGGNTPLWSLAYEFWFYLLAGYIGLMLGSSNRLIGTLFGVTLVFIVFTQFDASLLFSWCLGAFSYSFLSQNFKRELVFVGVALALAGYVLLQLLSGGENAQVLGTFLPSRAVATLVLSLGLGFMMP